MTEMLRIEQATKTFVMHNQDSRTLPVFTRLDLSLNTGECMALAGESGSGKSTLMRMVYGNYACPEGRILIRRADQPVDLASASPRVVIALRRDTVGYVSQFLRVIPRVPALDVVAEPLRAIGMAVEQARDRAASLLARLNMPERLWSLSPTTFSGGEQQRVNLARGFALEYPLLLLDEPTASLDRRNRQVVLDLITEARDRGAAILGIFHDAETREAVCTRTFDVAQFKDAA